MFYVKCFHGIYFRIEWPHIEIHDDDEQNSGCKKRVVDNKHLHQLVALEPKVIEYKKQEKRTMQD